MYVCNYVCMSLMGMWVSKGVYRYRCMQGYAVLSRNTNMSLTSLLIGVRLPSCVEPAAPHKMM